MKWKYNPSDLRNIIAHGVFYGVMLAAALIVACDVLYWRP